MNKTKISLKKIFILLFLSFPSILYAVETFTVRAPVSPLDERVQYDNDLIIKALKITEKDFGPFELKYSPVMNRIRAIESMKTDSLKNFIMKQSYDPNLSQKNMLPIEFPVDLGIVGIRVCFIAPQSIKKLTKSTTLRDFKKLTHLQGKGWTDVKILRQNGINVQEVGTYEALFKQIANGRGDLFCRGINEIKSEYESRKGILKSLKYDKEVLITYDIPRFFYVNKKNKKVANRIMVGLKRIYADGTLLKLWEEKYGESIKFANPKTRKIISLDNDLTEGISFDYKKYYYNIKQ